VHVTVPAGVGKNLPIRIRSFRSTSRTQGRLSLPQPAWQFSYDAPAINFVTLRRLDPADRQDAGILAWAADAGFVDASSIGGASSVPGARGIPAADVRVLEIMGANFGPGIGASAVTVQESGTDGSVLRTISSLALFDGSNLLAVVQNATSGDSQWRHGRIQLITSALRGAVSVVTRPANNAPSSTWQVSPSTSYSQESPLVSGLVGQQGGFQTQGGDILQVQVGNLQTAEPLRIEVGIFGSECPITDSDGNDQTPA